MTLEPVTISRDTGDLHVSVEVSYREGLAYPGSVLGPDAALLTPAEVEEAIARAVRDPELEVEAWKRRGL